MTQKVLTLRQSISWTLFGNILFSFCQWAILSSLSKLGNDEMVGQFTLAVAIVSPVFMLTGLQLRSLAATETSSSFNEISYFQLRFLTNGFSLFLIFLVTFVLSYDVQTIKVIWLVTILKLIEAFYDLSYGIFQRRERMDIVGKLMVTCGILSFLGFAASIYIFENIIIALSAYIVISAFIFVFFEYRQTFEKINFHLDKQQLLVLAKLGAPLGIVLFLISINANIQKYILSYYLDIKQVGYFSAIAYLTIVGNILINGIGQAVSFRLAQTIANNEKNELEQLMKKLNLAAMMAGGAGILISLLFGETVLTLLYDKQYAHYTNLLILVLIAATFQFMSTIQGYALTAARIVTKQPIVYIYVLTVSIVTSFIFIPIFGLNGAGYSMIASAIVQWLSSRHLFQRYALKRERG